LETQAKLYIQKLIHDGCLELTISYISHYENCKSPYSKNKTAIGKFFKNATTIIDIDKEDIIERKANEIMIFGIKSKDALHISCAIEAACDYFITTDDEILKKYKTGEIKVCSPVEFINIWEDFYEHNKHYE
jgi:predicted nucleic acid-binding protein